MRVIVDTRVLPGLGATLGWFVFGLPYGLCHEGGHLLAALVFRRNVCAFVVHRRKAVVAVTYRVSDRPRAVSDRLIYAAGPAGGAVFAACVAASLQSLGAYPAWPYWTVWLVNFGLIEFYNLVPVKRAGQPSDGYGVVWGRTQPTRPA